VFRLSAGDTGELQLLCSPAERGSCRMQFVARAQVAADQHPGLQRLGLEDDGIASQGLQRKGLRPHASTARLSMPRRPVHRSLSGTGL